MPGGGADGQEGRSSQGGGRHVHVLTGWDLGQWKPLGMAALRNEEECPGSHGEIVGNGQPRAEA